MPAFLAPLIAVVYWGILLREQAWYAGWDSNDFALHHSLIRLLLDHFHRGSLGLDAWNARLGMGSAMFRSYQNLGHYLLAAAAYLTGEQWLDRWQHAATVVALLLQIPAFAVTARRVGMSARAASFAALLSLLAAVRTQLVGNGLESYLSGGGGDLPQALALPAMVVALGYAIRVSSRATGDSDTRTAILGGCWLAFTFLLHHYLGFLVMLCWIPLFLGRPRDSFRATALAATICLALCAYQLLSLWQDLPLAQTSVLAFPEQRTGFGVAGTLSLLLEGAYLDWHRWPVLGLTALAGLVIAWRPGARAAERIWCVPLAVALFFLAGEKAWGDWGRFFPGTRHMHAERFGLLLEVAAVYFAASFLAKLSERRRLGMVVAIAVVAYAGWERTVLVRQQADRLAARAALGDLDPELRQALQRVTGDGRLWAGNLMLQPTLYRGVPLCVLATQHGIPQISSALHGMTHASEILYLYNPQRPHQSRAYDVTSIALPLTAAAPPRTTLAYSGSDISVYAAPGAGLFDVVGIRSRQVAEDDEAYFRQAGQVLHDPAIDRGEYPSVVPRAVIARWPAALPEISPPMPESGWGQVLEQDQHQALVNANGPGAYAIFRMAYHPRWRFLVNGRPEFPRWIAPAFMAVPLPPGRNRIEVTFPASPCRARLFLFTLLTGILTAVYFVFTGCAAKYAELRPRILAVFLQFPRACGRLSRSFSS